MSLINDFLGLEIPKTENPKLFNAKTLHDFPFAKIGINNIGCPIILISSRFDNTYLTQKNVKLKYIELTHNLECKVSENNYTKFDNYSVIVFKSSQEYLQKYFLDIVHPFLNSLSENPTQKEVLDSVKNFVEVFRSLSEAPINTIQGLWAELLLIDQSKNPEVLINYWHNFPEEKYDFNADREKIEVKSSSNMERIHVFTSEQLNPVSDCQVVIASIFTKQIANGVTALELSESIASRLSAIELKEKLYRIIAKTLGNNFEQTTKIKYDYDLAKKSLRFYKHQEISKVEQVNIPERVSEVKFKSNLTDINPINMNELKIEGQLFKNI